MLLVLFLWRTLTNKELNRSDTSVPYFLSTISPLKGRIILSAPKSLKPHTNMKLSLKNALFHLVSRLFFSI